MPKQQLIGDELDAETLQLLNEVGGYYHPHQTRRLDDIFDTSWLDGFIEDYLGG